MKASALKDEMVFLGCPSLEFCAAWEQGWGAVWLAGQCSVWPPRLYSIQHFPDSLSGVVFVGCAGRFSNSLQQNHRCECLYNSVWTTVFAWVLQMLTAWTNSSAIWKN